MSEIRKEKEQQPIGKQVLGMVLYIAVVIAAALLLNAFVIQKVKVDGGSMLPTLHNGEQLIVEKVSYYVKEPARYDIVVFRPYEENKKTLYIKRVMGMPGETVQIIDGYLYINGVKSEEQYGKDIMSDPGIARELITLGDDEYFVLGDNRAVSKDSRSNAVGVVKRGAIVGRASLRIWPLTKFGGID